MRIDRAGHKMSLYDINPQARQTDIPRRPFSRSSTPSQSKEFSDGRYEQRSPDRPGSSLKTLFTRTMSVKANSIVINSGRPTLSRASSSQLSIAEHDSATRVSFLTSEESRVTTSSTISWDPPPLFQAYSQALQHALLDSPSVSAESILRRQATVNSGGSTTPTNLDEVTLSETKTKKHKRKTSPSTGFGWTRKLYILLTGGYILQYSADGHHDRMPEKILPLGHNSVAFASDAICGRPYVLQISRDPEQDDDRLDVSTRKIWSRLGLRTAEERRMARSFLLVCENPHELDAWMSMVRREIEARGSAQYRSSTPRATAPGDSEADGDRLQAKYEPLPEIKTLSGLWSEQAFFVSRSSLDSSVNTATELDDLRESSQSTSSTATGHRPSLDESHSSLSPAEDLNNNNVDFPVYYKYAPAQKEKSLSSQVSLSPKREIATCPDQSRLSVCDTGSSPISCVPNFSMPNLSQRYSRSSAVLSDTSALAIHEALNDMDRISILEMPPSGDISSKRPTSTIAPLPSRESLVRKPRSRFSSAEYAGHRVLSVASGLKPSPITQQHCPHVKATAPSPAVAYSLFPKRYSGSDIPRTSQVSLPAETDLPDLSMAATHRRSLSTPRMEESINLLSVPVSRMTRRPASMQLALKHSLEIERSERSPAVTDLHFATNFGTANPFDRSRSGFRETPAISPARVGATDTSMQKPARPASLLRRKAGSGSAIGLPAGPPPTCPLPAPPSAPVRGSSVPANLHSHRRIFLDLTIED